jgi:acetyl esterase/lipase
VYHAVAPSRVLDTRQTGGTPGDTTITVDTRLGDVTATAVAVAVQLTVADCAGPGFLTAWSGEGPRPGTSVLNMRRRGDVDGNFVIVPAIGGTFAVYTSATAGIVVDVMGYVTDEPADPPRRLVDTREVGGTPGDSAITVATGLPAGTAVAAVQITVADAAAPGFLTAWSGLGRRPHTSVLNLRGAGDVDGNFVVVPLAPDATLGVYTSVTAGIVVDLMGAPAGYTPTRPQRLLDTRQTGGTSAGSVVRVDTDLHPGASCAAIQLTVADATGPGFLTAWDGDVPVPEVSTLNCTGAGHTDGNFVIVPVRDGACSVFTTMGAGVVVDLMGYTGEAVVDSHDVSDPNPSTVLPDDLDIGPPHLTHAYGPHPLHTLDVHRGPAGRTLVWLHGGGWEGGDKSLDRNAPMGNFNRVPRLLHADGWTVVSVNYRLSPHAHLREIVADFHAALRAVGRHAPDWGVDTDRIVVGGFSAGAHIAALGVTARDDEPFHPPADLPGVRAIVSQDGNLMTSLFAAAVPEGTLDVDGNDLSPRPAIARLLGAADGSFASLSAAQIAESDLATYSSPSAPPLYLIGATHSVIPFSVQTRTRDLVRAAGQVVVFDGVDTGPEWSRLHDVLGLNWAALCLFLDTVTR